MQENLDSPFLRIRKFIVSGGLVFAIAFHTASHPNPTINDQPAPYLIAYLTTPIIFKRTF